MHRPTPTLSIPARGLLSSTLLRLSDRLHPQSANGLLLVVALLAAASLVGCRAWDPATDDALHSLSGHQITYRFATGRVYRARHNDHQVEFELLEPEVVPRPGARLDYREVEIRPGLILSTWIGEPKFHLTMLVDLQKGEIHISALYDGSRSIFETAELIAIEPLP